MKTKAIILLNPVLIIYLVCVVPTVSAKTNFCQRTSLAALQSCQAGALSDYWLAGGKCDNFSDPVVAKACQEQASADRQDAVKNCNDQYQARQAVCKLLGGDPYDPQIVKTDFVTNLTGNTYFPLQPATYTYKSYAPDGTVTEKDIVEVTNQTRQILGVTCRVVRDIVTDPDDNVTEDTTDWYAQDVKGNVWYFGEIAQQFQDGILVGIEGSWTAGVEGAKPGFIMLANPKVGNVYRQEFALGDAEDMGRVVETGLWTIPLPSGVNLPNGVQGPYLHTQDFSALDPGSVLEGQYEEKYYAPGVGLVLVIAPDGTKEVLVSITKP